mgnify:FL=1
MNAESNFRKFIFLWVGELISQIGGGLTSFGLGVYVFQHTGRATDMALITLIGFLPGLILSIPAGVLADKYDRRLLMVIGDGCSGMGIVFILWCMINGEATLSQIGIGVFISSAFSSLLEPSYKATINDLLTKEDFSKASGLLSLAGSAKYLFSPIIAGLLLTISDVKLLLMIDICTFILTVVCTLIIRKSIEKKNSTTDCFLRGLKDAWNVVYRSKGVFILVMLAVIITLFIGIFQVLAVPMLLSITDSKTLGTAETICASGMLISGIFLGIRGIKKNFVKILSISLTLSGVFILGFGIFERVLPMCLFGFLFFAALPFASNCLEYLSRTNIPDEFQGRAWGLIGFLSQLGYVVAYSVSGTIADHLRVLTGRGVGRASAMIVGISGICLMAISLCIPMIKKIRELENNA